MDELKELVTKLERAFHDRLISVILYGSGASGPESSDHSKKFSDLNVLCVVKQVTPRELGEGEPVLRWWSQHHHSAPLLMSEEEIYNGSDSFPIEFRDIKDRRKVLFGVDVIADVNVSQKNHRVLVEHELRSKLLRLRQQGARVLSNPVELLNLCVDSVATFCVLGRHALIAAGIDPKSEKRAIVRQLGATIVMDVKPMELLLDIREDRSGSDPGDPGELFASYLQCIQRMVEYVDRLEEK